MPRLKGDTQRLDLLLAKEGEHKGLMVNGRKKQQQR
jgi:hypothetical protein